MRPIEFRAWYQREGESTGAMFFVGDEYGTTHPLDCCTYLMQGQPVTLMQFTGLHDKNGVKIFEDDIVMWGGDVVETVSFSDCMFQTESSCIDSCMTVIGNIHQNPELLEQ